MAGLSILCLSVASSGQIFEVASVRTAAPLTIADTVGPVGATTGGPGTASPERISWRSTHLGPLILVAYGIKRSQLVAPAWVTDFDEDVRYDISAKVPAGATKDQIPAMLEALLRERFGLQVHREYRDLAAQLLTVSRDGKLTKSTPTSPSHSLTYSSRGSTVKVTGRQVTTGELAGMIEFLLRGEGLQVLDRTGLTGTYDVGLEYSNSVVGAPDSDLPTLTRALDQNLGLRLVKEKVRTEVVVVDHVDKVPTEN
jgi:uncharacterized protein (TIGR03435 family)